MGGSWARYGSFAAMLEQIHSPADLKGLSHDELTDLAQEIREFIVDAVDDAGSGHLGSNLGAVELTLALHRVFDSPRDIILWDTGHQAYVHKIAHRPPAPTSPTLRQAGGLSGYPSPGRVRARLDREQPRLDRPLLRPRPRRRPGAASSARAGGSSPSSATARMTGGMAFEGLNNLGHSRPQRRSSSSTTTAGRTPRRSPGSARAWPASASTRPTCATRPASSASSTSVPVVGDRLERGLDGHQGRHPRDVGAARVLRDLGVRYTGPFDGHDIDGLERGPAQRRRVRRARRRPRAHPEGPGPRPRRERPDQAPARHRRR